MLKCKIENPYVTKSQFEYKVQNTYCAKWHSQTAVHVVTPTKVNCHNKSGKLTEEQK